MRWAAPSWQQRLLGTDFFFWLSTRQPVWRSRSRRTSPADGPHSSWSGHGPTGILGTDWEIKDVFRGMSDVTLLAHGWAASTPCSRSRLQRASPPRHVSASASCAAAEHSRRAVRLAPTRGLDEFDAARISGTPRCCVRTAWVPSRQAASASRRCLMLCSQAGASRTPWGASGSGRARRPSRRTCADAA